jgi:hypothetical protein
MPKLRGELIFSLAPTLDSQTKQHQE